MYFLNLDEPQWVPTLGMSEPEWEYLREGENHAARETLRAEWAQLQEDRQVSIRLKDGKMEKKLFPCR